jgi:hypothetical protein
LGSRPQLWSAGARTPKVANGGWWVRVGYVTILSAQPDMEVVGEASNAAISQVVRRMPA